MNIPYCSCLLHYSMHGGWLAARGRPPPPLSLLLVLSLIERRVVPAAVASAGVIPTRHRRTTMAVSRQLVPVLALAQQLLPAAAAVAPWQMYGRGPHHSREQPELLALPTNASGWVAKTAGWVYGAPCVDSNETVYFSSWDGHLYAVHADGRPKWRHRVGGAGIAGQIWSSPALAADEGTIYVGANNSLQAIDTRGSAPVLRWAVRTNDAIFASPTVAADGVIYIGDLNGAMRSVDANGTVLWTHKTIAPIYASAAVSDAAVYFSTLLDGRMIALSRQDGQLLWSKGHDLAPVPSSPALSSHDASVVYSASSDGQLRAYRAADGSIAWVGRVGPVDGSSPAVSVRDGTIYIGCLDNQLYAISPHDGTVKWKFRADSMIQASPAIGGSGVIYVNSYSSSMYAIEVETGEARWMAKLGASSFSSPALGRKGVYVGANHGLVKGGLHAFLG